MIGWRLEIGDRFKLVAYVEILKTKQNGKCINLKLVEIRMHGDKPAMRLGIYPYIIYIYMKIAK